jgi:hypothetical protein
MEASVPSVIGGCADALKACDWSFRGALLRDASCQIPTTAKVMPTPTEVIESTPQRAGVQILFYLALLFCAVVIK